MNIMRNVFGGAILFILYLIFSTNLVRTTNWDPDKEAKLDSFIESLTQCRDNVGMFVALVKDGQVVFTGGYGSRNLEDDLPVTSTTKFNIGSLSKAFTTALAADAISQSPSASWDTPLADILGGDFQLQDEFRSEEANLRDIFSHKLGMPSYWGLSTAAMNVTREHMIMEYE